jgi:membrane protein
VAAPRVRTRLRRGEVLAALARRVAAVLTERFRRYASAMALQLLTAVIPLALLSFLLLGTFGLESIWRDQVAPALQERASKPLFQAVDATAGGLMRGTHASWLLGAVLITLWEISGAVRTVTGALNRVFELEETRSLARRFGTSFALAVPLALCTLGSMLLTMRGGGIVDLGVAQPVWALARWFVVVFLLWFAVALLIRFAPNGYQAERWVSLGGGLVIAGWIGISSVYGWWVTSVASYETPFGTAIALLTLIGYLYASAIVFLVGALVDRLLEEQAGRGKGPFDGVV